METLKLVDLVEYINKLGFSNVVFDEDIEGQIIIHTGMRLDDQENLVPTSTNQEEMEEEMKNDRFKQIPGYSDGCLLAYFKASYAELEAAFGPPMGDDDDGDGKMSTVWRVLDTKTHKSFDIYDYKEVNVYDKEQVQKFRSLPHYDWHIGGTKTPDLDALAKFLEQVQHT